MEAVVEAAVVEAGAVEAVVALTAGEHWSLHVAQVTRGFVVMTKAAVEEAVVEAVVEAAVVEAVVEAAAVVAVVALTAGEHWSLHVAQVT